jgi:ethanolamine-phosphate cytidylyltransferase
MPHMGHVHIIEKAKELGTYLIVGVHDDKTVHEHKGKNYPIMNAHERALNILAIKHVDDVIIGAPWFISEDLINSLNISVVAQGTV